MKKILIVDQNISELAKLREGITSYGEFEVVTARNARIAARLLNMLKFDLLITETDLPEINGLKLLAYVKKRFSSVPVILMNENGTSELIDHAITLGAAHFLNKPVDIDRLADLLFEELDILDEGDIHGISLASFLQLINMEGKTCSLTIKSPKHVGYIYFSKGELIGARTVHLNGRDALYDILSWEKTAIQVDDACHMDTPEIQMPLMYLLMESHALQDENMPENNSSSDIAIHRPLKDDMPRVINTIKDLPGMCEYSIADAHGNQIANFSENNWMAGLLPSDYLKMGNDIGQNIGSNSLQYVIIKKLNGFQYSVFRLENNIIVAGFNPGANPSDSIKKLLIHESNS